MQLEIVPAKLVLHQTTYTRFPIYAYSPPSSVHPSIQSSSQSSIPPSIQSSTQSSNTSSMPQQPFPHPQQNQLLHHQKNFQELFAPQAPCNSSKHRLQRQNELSTPDHSLTTQDYNFRKQQIIQQFPPYVQLQHSDFCRRTTLPPANLHLLTTCHNDTYNSNFSINHNQIDFTQKTIFQNHIPTEQVGLPSPNAESSCQVLQEQLSFHSGYLHHLEFCHFVLKQLRSGTSCIIHPYTSFKPSYTASQEEMTSSTNSLATQDTCNSMTTQVLIEISYTSTDLNIIMLPRWARHSFPSATGTPSKADLPHVSILFCLFLRIFHFEKFFI